MAPPSAALEHADFGTGGVIKPFTSAASDTGICQSLVLTCFVAFLIYNIFSFFNIDISAINNFGTMVYRALVKYVAVIGRHGSQRIFIIDQRIFIIDQRIINIVNSFRNWVTSTYRSSLDAYAFHTELKRMFLNLRELHGQNILVEIITVPGTGSLAMIRGLPYDVTAPELRRYLELILFDQYGPQLKTEDTINRDENRTIDGPFLNDTEYAPIDTSCNGLWNGTCVRADNDVTDAPNTSGINTPASGSTASSTCLLDLAFEGSAFGLE